MLKGSCLCKAVTFGIEGLIRDERGIRIAPEIDD